MLLKKTIGIVIIVLNIGGLGFLLYMLGMMLKEKYFIKEQQPLSTEPSTPAVTKHETETMNDTITPYEDDLLKDMDLSDLDDLDLDDFK